jgi:hypothetical protein
VLPSTAPLQEIAEASVSLGKISSALSSFTGSLPHALPVPRESRELVLSVWFTGHPGVALVSLTAEPAAQAPAVLPPEGILCQLLGEALLKALQSSNGMSLPSSGKGSQSPGNASYPGSNRSLPPVRYLPHTPTEWSASKGLLRSPGLPLPVPRKCHTPREQTPPRVIPPIPREYFPRTPHEHGASKGVAKSPNRANECDCGRWGWQERLVGGHKGLEKSETRVGEWTRSHVCRFAAPLPLLEGAGSELNTERMVWIGLPSYSCEISCP